MSRRDERSDLATKILPRTNHSAGGEDSVEKGSWGWRFPTLLFLVGVGFFLIGFLLVFLGSTGPASSGGCFFWPFPVIVACGLGTGGGSFLLFGLFASVLTLLTVLLVWLTRKPSPQGSPVEEPARRRESHYEW